MSSQQRSTVTGRSGVRMTSAPPAMPAMTAIQPAWRPMTSQTITRSWDSAVECRRSMASVAIETRGVEPERVVGAGEVVVDRLRDADDVHLMLAVEARRDAQRVLAADGDQRVQPAQVLEHALDAALDLVGVRARRLQDRPAAGQDPRDVDRPEFAELALDQPAPAVQDADDLVAAVEGPPRHRPDDRVQPGAVATAREDPDSHPGGV